MRVAIDLVKSGEARRLRQRRQHRRADGDLALRAQDAARHRPSGDRLGAAHHERAAPTCSISAPTSTARPSTCCSSRVMGCDPGRAPWSTGSARRVGLLNIGEEEIKGNEVVKQAAELLRASGAQLPRQRRRQRHLQGHDRRRGLRRLRRQRRAQDLRGPGADAGHLPARGVHAQPAPPSWPRWSRCRCSPRSGAASTRAATTARRCSGCAASWSRATARPTGFAFAARSSAPPRRCGAACSSASRERLAVAEPAALAEADVMNVFAHHRHRQLPAAARSSPTQRARARASTPPTSGSSRAPASASATSPPSDRRRATSRSRRRARRSRPPGRPPATST